MTPFSAAFVFVIPCALAIPSIAQAEAPGCVTPANALVLYAKRADATHEGAANFYRNLARCLQDAGAIKPETQVLVDRQACPDGATGDDFASLLENGEIGTTFSTLPPEFLDALGSGRLELYSLQFGAAGVTAMRNPDPVSAFVRPRHPAAGQGGVFQQEAPLMQPMQPVQLVPSE